MTKEEKQEVNLLVKRLKNNDEEAITKLYTMMYKVIFAFLRSRCKNNEVIKDIISQTFVTLIEDCKKPMFYTNCYSYILGIAYNKLRNLRRKHSKEIFLEDYQLDLLEVNKTNGIDDNTAIAKAINELDTYEQKLVILKYRYGSTIKEMAYITNLSESTVKRKMKNAQKSLKEKLGDEQ